MDDPIEILITLPFSDELMKKVADVSPRITLEKIVARKLEEVNDEVWKRVEVLYTNRVLPKPEQAPRLRWIQFHWAGLDHALDEAILQKEGLAITSMSGASAPQMAEHAISMMLALGHHLPDLIAYQRKAEWPSGRWELFTPRELRDSTVGIVGYGSIGRQIARLLQVFGTTVLATKRDIRHPEDTGYIPDGLGDPGGDLVNRLYPPEALCSMLKECDYVVVCLPRTSATKNLLGAKELAACKPGAYLVDISRGEILDHNALIPLLRERKLAGAALDVFPVEPLPADSPLWKLPNVIITPHIAGFSPHYDERAAELFTQNLRRYLEQLPLYNRLDPALGY
ncbi:MAG: D-2-hydroxyacid dehydrogenase [Anaerolineales bacterium]|nr:D-2-hydroxyacid dehydrogenase [Anaerolineae bacterium]PWB54630.1 MAG: D-2-hydroxyacid dehydrogenase [Anaerolineales bacterium]